MFRSQVIVLYIQRIRDNRTRIILFSREYGKITCWSKKQVLADIGNIATVLIERVWGENYLKSIDTLFSLESILQSYDEVTLFLEVMNSLYKFLPESGEHTWVYDDIRECIKICPSRHCTNKEGNTTYLWNIQLFILIHIRILKKLWFLNQWLFHSSDILRYIYEHIEKKLVLEIAQGRSLEQTLIDTLKNIILQTHHSLNYWI